LIFDWILRNEKNKERKKGDLEKRKKEKKKKLKKKKSEVRRKFLNWLLKEKNLFGIFLWKKKKKKIFSLKKKIENRMKRKEKMGREIMVMRKKNE